ncbi:Transmembrane 9 superfamily member 1 [Toxocara canis]|uniref:Transmembrane 9 superfamily member n=1 Tax=Toxocara canis TaxID=6265 RepID=A0A0B2VST4_TOXCA|nr:Transmembrane 9 superfamily member 1 [Toxocara canis]
MAVVQRHCWCLFLLCSLLLIDHAHADKYKIGDNVPVYVNKVGPYGNIHETYHFFQLPICRPEKVVHKSLSLGQVLEGDRIAESSFEINFAIDEGPRSLCGKYAIAKPDFDILERAIEDQFYIELIVDGFRVRTFLGFVEEQNTFPHLHKLFVYNHFIFQIDYNADTEEIISVKLLSDVHSAKDLSAFENEVEWLYSVRWTRTVETIRQEEDKKAFFSPQTIRIQWMAVLNSALLVVLLVFFVALILLSIVRRDLNRYNDAKDDELLLENGWKTISMDVFRTPKHAGLFAAILGVGSQFIFLTLLILVLGSTNVVNVHRHGALYTLAVVLYACTSGISGFVSARKYRQFDGTEWIKNVNLTTALFTVPMFLVWALNNTISWAYNSTQALPYTTIIALALLWLCVGYPLTVIGVAVGKNVSSRYSAPCRIRNVPRQLPILPWYHSTIYFGFVGGFLPFSAISVELYYVFSAVWGREVYVLFYIILIMFFIMIMVVATTSVY